MDEGEGRVRAGLVLGIRRSWVGDNYGLGIGRFKACSIWAGVCEEATACLGDGDGEAWIGQSGKGLLELLDGT